MEAGTAMPCPYLFRLGFFGGGYGFEAVGLVAGDDGAVASADHGEAFGEAHARATPPVAADCAASNVLNPSQRDSFVDVEVSLEDCDDVVSVEEWQHFVRVAYGESAVFAGCYGLTPGRVCGDERDVNRDDDWFCGAGALEIVFEPGELCGVDARVPEAVFGGLDRVEDDEVPALVIEGVVGFAEAVFVHFFAVAGIGRRSAAGGVDAEDVVIADDLMERHL